MSCEHLICARCQQPVVEGRCATCRGARDELHRSGSFSVPPVLIVALILALTLLVVFKLS
jgi:hypothetical protein